MAYSTNIEYENGKNINIFIPTYGDQIEYHYELKTKESFSKIVLKSDVFFWLSYWHKPPIIFLYFDNVL